MDIVQSILLLEKSTEDELVRSVLQDAAKEIIKLRAVKTELGEALIKIAGPKLDLEGQRQDVGIKDGWFIDLDYSVKLAEETIKRVERMK